MPKLLLIASTGGHLAQLVRLADRYEASADSLWITFDTEQSRKLLQGRRVEYVGYIRPRDLLGTIKAAQRALAILQTEAFDEAISTGAALAAAVLPIARFKGIRARYIESVSRFEGPSLTGRILAASRLVALQCQHPGYPSRWKRIDSVLADYVVETDAIDRKPSPKVFITLGTIRPYRFDALVDAVMNAGIDLTEATWQLGETERAGLPGTIHTYMDGTAFKRTVEDSDVVITHAGVGTILNLLDLGKYPIAVPRLKSRREHVDDHQLQVCQFLQESGVGIAISATDLTAGDVLDAATKSIATRTSRSNYAEK